MAQVVDVNDGSFDVEVLKSDLPVIVGFWAEWAEPSKTVSALLEEATGDYGDRLKVAKVNVGDNPGIPAKFAVRGIPTLLLFKNGAVAAQKVGALSKSQLYSFLDSRL
ncbi:thioredoxin domain-containing protein [Kitasatospora sp. NPDC004669]|uniref:thioredoxin family protein n=1 Tax=Kitasatospora sp. NPDC004669 TaxID=3154555 RepID=UPI0033BBF6F4